MKILREQKLLNYVENNEGNKEVHEYLKINDYFHEFSSNLKIYNDYFNGKYLCIGHKSRNLTQKYKYYGCKGPYERNCTRIDQVKYADSIFRNTYTPKEMIEVMIDEENEKRKLQKMKGNCLVIKPCGQNTYNVVTPNLPSSLTCTRFMVTSKNGKQDLNDTPENDNNQGDNTLAITKISYKFNQIPLGIYQIENCQDSSNDFYVRSLQNAYRFRLNDDDNTLQENQDVNHGMDLITKIMFEGELLDCKTSKFFENQTFFLTNRDKVICHDENKPITYTLNSTESINFSIKYSNNFTHLDTSHNPYMLYLSNHRQIGLYDTREGKINTLYKNNLQLISKPIIYGLKHIKDQFFICSTEHSITINDIRYPCKPLSNLKHYCDENPLNILDYHKTFDLTEFKIDEEGLVDWDNLLGCDIDNNGGANAKDKHNHVPSGLNIIYGYSTNKSGYSLVFPGMYDYHFDSMNDKYFDLSTKNDCLYNIANLYNMHDKASDYLYDRCMKPIVLYNNNMKNLFSKINGMKLITMKKDMFIACTSDTNNHNVFQVIKTNNEKGYHHVPIVYESSLPSKLEEKNAWNEFNMRVKHQMLENHGIKINDGGSNKNEPKQLIDLSKSENFEDIEEEFDIDEITIKRAKRSKKNCLQARKVFELLLTDSKIYQRRLGHLRNKIYSSTRIINKQTIQKVSSKNKLINREYQVNEANESQDNLKPTLNREYSTQENDLKAYDSFKMAEEYLNQVFERKFESFKSIDELKQGKKFVITNNLIDYLDNEWNENE